MRQYRNFLRGSILEYVIIGLLFVLLTGFYTNWIIFDISRHMFVQHIGDGTAGFLWLNFADKDANPILGHTNLINYPLGDHLGDTSFIVYSALWLPMWILARMFDPMTALNLITLWGFFSGGFGMYWLIKRLLGNAPIAFLAGFAVAFVPYHIINSSSHLAYIFSVVFIMILAAFIGLWQRQTKKRAVLLAATMALAFYTDGYFILLGSVLIVSLCCGGALFGLLEKYSKKDYTQRLRYLGLAALVFFMMTLPLVYTQFSSSAVKTELADARKSISDEIPYYAAKKIDFVAPPLKSPVFEDLQIYKDAQKKMADHSNYAENTLYIGFVVIALCIAGSVIFILSFVRRGGKNLLPNIDASTRRKALFLACLTITPMPVMLAFMAKPYIDIAGLHVTMPSGLLIDNDIALWRVMTRFFLPLHMLIVVCSAISLWLIFKQMGRRVSSLRMQWIIAALLTLLLACEYATTINRPGFSLNDVPAAYSWLAEQKDINTIVELPLVDRPFHISYPYVAAQIVHGKSLINSHLPSQPSGSRNALGTADNPDTIDFAIARGAQAVITHGKDCAQVSWGKLTFEGEGWPTRLTRKIQEKTCIYTSLQSPTADKQFAHVLEGTGAEGPLYKNGKFYNQFYGNYLKLGVYDAEDRPITTNSRSIFRSSLMTTPKHEPFKGTYRVVQNKKVIAYASFDTASGAVPIDVIIDPAIPIEIRISDEAGNAPTPYQLTLGNITVTAQ